MSGQAWQLVPLPTDPYQRPCYRVLLCVVYVCVYILGHVWRTTCWFPSFYHVSHGNWTQIFRVAGKYLYLLSYLLSCLDLVLLTILVSLEIWSCRWQLFQIAVPSRPHLLSMVCIDLSGVLQVSRLPDTRSLALCVCRFLVTRQCHVILALLGFPFSFPTFHVHFVVLGVGGPSPLPLNCSPPVFSQCFASIRFWWRQQGLAVS